MVRPKKEERREKISVTLPQTIIGWLDKKVKEREFANRSHAVEVAVLKLKESEK